MPPGATETLSTWSRGELFKEIRPWSHVQVDVDRDDRNCRCAEMPSTWGRELRHADFARDQLDRLARRGLARTQPAAAAFMMGLAQLCDRWAAACPDGDVREVNHGGHVRWLLVRARRRDSRGRGAQPRTQSSSAPPCTGVGANASPCLDRLEAAMTAALLLFAFAAVCGLAAWWLEVTHDDAR